MGADGMEEAGEEEDDETKMNKMLDQAEGVEIMDIHQLKRAILSLERKIAKNQEMRVKHADEPTKFLDSEVELYADINNLQALATAPELYGEFVKLNAVQKLSELLDHENVDITLATIELVNELTDPDALGEMESGECFKDLVNAMIENAFLELLAKNLDRIDESEDDGRQGVYNALSIIENLSELQPHALEAICEKTELVPWLFKRLRVKTFDQNKLYCSEIISILCQQNQENQKKIGSDGGMDILLQLTSSWKKKDPKDSDESEMIQNLFDSICSCVMVPENLAAFVEGEGIELMVIMLQARKFAARCALKVLDYSLSRSTTACERFVNATGLKTLFPGLLKPQSILANCNFKEAKGGVREDEEHVISIISSLILRLGGDLHARVLQKFVENGFEKLDKLIELHEKYYTLVETSADDDDKDEEEEDAYQNMTAEERRYLARLDKGLFILQLVDTILAFLLTEDLPGIDKRIRMLLHQSDAGIEQVIKVMKEYNENIGEETTGGDEALNMKEITGDLLEFLKEQQS
uniref:Beta-catenin-like protein 1 N-terminal domain-containing protein n=2 Tax=Hanusia phi TaxID=3032 RepID=A0A7S0HXA0_9CRYP|mmetsp:Transcript_5569/g.12949  ORF Transcript_5569/g.12949 Transcript_5569/m.12949 type:complete len:527 (+) Transcript_5569:63-1643(+)